MNKKSNKRKLYEWPHIIGDTAAYLTTKFINFDRLLPWPEWPSPHDSTSSILDELVLIQLLNLVQSQRLSQTFFWARP